VLAEERQPAAAAAGQGSGGSGSSGSKQPRDPTKNLFYPDGLLLPGWIIKVGCSSQVISERCYKSTLNSLALFTTQ
jgi:hypothetical protein